MRAMERYCALVRDNCVLQMFLQSNCKFAKTYVPRFLHVTWIFFCIFANLRSLAIYGGMGIAYIYILLLLTNLVNLIRCRPSPPCSFAYSLQICKENRCIILIICTFYFCKFICKNKTAKTTNMLIYNT